MVLPAFGPTANPADAATPGGTAGAGVNSPGPACAVRRRYSRALVAGRPPDPAPSAARAGRGEPVGITRSGGIAAHTTASRPTPAGTATSGDASGTTGDAPAHLPATAVAPVRHPAVAPGRHPAVAPGVHPAVAPGLHPAVVSGGAAAASDPACATRTSDDGCDAPDAAADASRLHTGNAASTGPVSTAHAAITSRADGRTRAARPSHAIRSAHATRRS
ncbi:MAG: hypothetical protein QOI86_5504, partial [Actinomycetota bacterium]|nr:hypothetical protein [Actinomycetota bacterium]